MTTFATYFDANFLHRGAACIRSIARHATERSRVVVLTLDEISETFIRPLVEPLPEGVDLVVVPLAELEEKYPALREAKRNRETIEYYFTLTPFLCLEAVSRSDPGEFAVYVDADMYFFGDPGTALGEIGTGSVAVTEHRFPGRLAHLAVRYGRFNVGWLAFDGSDASKACLDQWGSECLDWCRDTPEHDRFGDQKYLDLWPGRVERLTIVDDPSVNAAPWNAESHEFGCDRGAPTIDGRPLIVFHFHRLRRLRDGVYEADFDGFGVITAALARHVYEPYLAELRDLDARLRRMLPEAPRPALNRFAPQPSLLRRAVHQVLKVKRTLRKERVIFDPTGAVAPLRGLLYG